MKIIAKAAIASVVAVALLMTISIAYASQLADDTNFKAAVGAQELMSDKGVQENLKREWADHFDTLNATEQRDAYTEAMLQGKISITDIVAYDARHRYIEHYIESLLELEHGSHTSFADVSYLEKLAALGNTTELEKENAKLEKKIKKLEKKVDKLQTKKANKIEKADTMMSKMSEMKGQMAERDVMPIVKKAIEHYEWHTNTTINSDLPKEMLLEKAKNMDMLPLPPWHIEPKRFHLGFEDSSGLWAYYGTPEVGGKFSYYNLVIGGYVGNLTMTLPSGKIFQATHERSYDNLFTEAGKYTWQITTWDGDPYVGKLCLGWWQNAPCKDNVPINGTIMVTDAPVCDPTVWTCPE